MPPKKVLIIVHDFPPFGGGAVIRTLKYVKYLQTFGWQPTVLTLTHNYPLVEDKSLLAQIPEGVEVIRTSDTKLMDALGKRRKSNLDSDSDNSTKPNLIYKILKRLKDWILDFIYMPDREKAWLKIARKALALIDLDQFDLFYTTTPPHSVSLLGLSLKNEHPEKPWIWDLRDAWVKNPLYTSRFFWNRLRAKQLEKKVATKADKIITTTKETTESYQERYSQLPQQKFITLTNGFDPEDFESIPQQIRSDKFVITYIGSMMQTRNPEGFIQALKNIINQRPEFKKDLQIELYGILDPHNKALFQDKELKDKVTFHGNQPHKVATKALGDTVLNLQLSSPGEGGQGVAPAKIYEYFASRRPILALTQEGAAARMIKEAEAGKIAGPSETKLIENYLLTFYNKWKDNPQSLLVPEENINQYNRKQITKRLATTFDELTD